MILEIVLGVSAAAAIGIAFKKHGTLTAVLASAKKEASNLEAFAARIPADAKVEYAAIVARLKTLGL
jgi:hypothetical protein